MTKAGIDLKDYSIVGDAQFPETGEDPLEWPGVFLWLERQPHVDGSPDAHPQFLRNARQVLLLYRGVVGDLMSHLLRAPDLQVR